MNTWLLAFGEPVGQGWEEIIELAVALGCSSLIGLERELSQKNAGLRTQSLVGLGAALFVLVSKYGFTDVLHPGTIVLDPSRVAAQIVTGVGFLGAGLIFVRHEGVQGLTTAATVWLTAAVGAACGAGLLILAGVTTGAHFLVTQGYTWLMRRLGLPHVAEHELKVRLRDNAIEAVLATVTTLGYNVKSISTRSLPEREAAVYEPELRAGGEGTSASSAAGLIDATVLFQGTGGINDLAANVSRLSGVIAVEASAGRVMGE